VLAKSKGLKQGANDDEEPNQASRWWRVTLPDLQGLLLWTNRGEAGEGAEGAGNEVLSMSVDSIMEQVKALLKHMEKTWGNDPMPELVQCTMLAHWAAAEASAMVEEEGRVAKLEVVLAVMKVHMLDLHRVWQHWQDVTVYAEVGREVMREKWGLEEEE
jgi:hypothetical protein